MLQQPTIRRVAPTKAPRAPEPPDHGLTADPIMRWLWPEPHDYIRHFPRLVQGFGGRAFENESAHVTDDFRGGTLFQRAVGLG